MNKIIVDTSNLYYGISKAYTNKRLDYKKLVDRLADQFGVFTERVAYVALTGDTVDAFKRYLEEDCGFSVVGKMPRKFRFGKDRETGKEISYHATNFNVEIAVEATQHMLTGTGTLVIGCTDIALVPLYKEYQQKFIVTGVGIPRTVRDYCPVFEINEDLLV